MNLNFYLRHMVQYFCRENYHSKLQNRFFAKSSNPWTPSMNEILIIAPIWIPYNHFYKMAFIWLTISSLSDIFSNFQNCVIHSLSWLFLIMLQIYDLEQPKTHSNYDLIRMNKPFLIYVVIYIALCIMSHKHTRT